jgi:restriction system protein
VNFYHYPPDIMNLLIDTIPRLNKSKKDVLLFFKGAGVPASITQPLETIVRINRDSISKYEIARKTLEAINEENDRYLKQRREILKRVCQFDTFDVCYDNDRDKAKANVIEISKLVNMKDTLTKYEIHLNTKRREEQTKRREALEKRQKLNSQFEVIKSRFYSLFSMCDPIKRGKALEPVLNDLFAFYKIGLSDAFTVKVECDIVEQIDGAMLLDGKVYLIEMKWEKDPIGVEKVGRFISRLFLRNDVGGVMVSASSFTEPAIKTANEALSQKSLALVDLKDIYEVVEHKKDLQQFFKLCITNSQINKKANIKVDIMSLSVADFSRLI